MNSAAGVGTCEEGDVFDDRKREVLKFALLRRRDKANIDNASNGIRFLCLCRQFVGLCRQWLKSQGFQKDESNQSIFTVT